MKLEFVPNVQGEDMLQVCGISEERFYNDFDPKIRGFLERFLDEEDYQADQLLRDYLSMAETPGEFAFLAFQAGRKVEELENMYSNPAITLLANAIKD